MIDEQPNRRILIIDDNESIHHDFAKILAHTESSPELVSLEDELFGDSNSASSSSDASELAFELSFASQGQQGCEMLREAIRQLQPFAMAFVDMRMPPGWDGVTTIEHLWQIDPDLEVVICTAYSDYSWQQTMKRLGHPDQLLLLKNPLTQ
ncbi:response regulator transcription factor [Candidatus Entotheonella palauensis]|uniref:response regulator transcription factor n=1 Tax=Candidatus Entotheonella palauensis TaxID=93172 RepID=UPI000B7D8BC8|nr:response regulator [Candidatus Entotheonella palauensis]